MNRDTLAQGLGAATAGMEMAISILTGCVLGYVACGLVIENVAYIGLMIGAALGLVLGIYRLYKKYR